MAIYSTSSELGIQALLQQNEIIAERELFSNLNASAFALGEICHVSSFREETTMHTSGYIGKTLCELLEFCFS